MKKSQLLIELRSNFKDFDSQWRKELRAVASKNSASVKTFRESYSRIASIQAWRTTVIADKLDDDCAAFFFEAQNDLLVSHCLAKCGSFRQALKSLRSAIENVYFALYYMDHPVELLKWLKGGHRITFTELSTYFNGHPALAPFGKNATGLATLGAEYSTLSKAVHASAKQFRMTTDLTDTKLWLVDQAAIGRWATREKNVITALNTLLLHMFASQLQGAKHLPLRRTLGLVFNVARRSQLKTRLGVTLVQP